MLIGFRMIKPLAFDTAALAAGLEEVAPPVPGFRAYLAAGDVEHRYILIGKRGAVYGLVPDAKRPELLYAVNLRQMRFVVAIKGNAWFTDEDGELRIAG